MVNKHKNPLKLLPRPGETAETARVRAITENHDSSRTRHETDQPGFLTRLGELVVETPKAVATLGAIGVAAAVFITPEAFRPTAQMGHNAIQLIEKGASHLYPDEHPPTFKDSP